MVFIFVGLLTLFVKGSRYVYVLLSLEILVCGMLMFNITAVSDLGYILLLIISVVSSVVGLTIMVVLLASYGSDSVKF